MNNVAVCQFPTLFNTQTFITNLVFLKSLNDYYIYLLLFIIRFNKKIKTSELDRTRKQKEKSPRIRDPLI